MQKPTTIHAAQKAAAQALLNNGIENADFDAAQLTAHALGISHDRLPLMKTEPMENSAQEKLQTLMNERISGRPLQYILGEWEFYSLPFFVKEGVLIPRPETELLVDCALEYIKENNVSNIVDLCCGSGCIAVVVAKNAPNTQVEAIDFYETPCEVTVRNIGQCACDNVTVTKADVLKGAKNRTPDLILSNPPYITARDMQTLQLEVTHEPQTALFGGDDGLIFYRAIADKWVPSLKKGGAVMLEVGINQATDVAEMLENKALITKIINDLSGIPRVVIGQKNLEV